MLVGKVPGGEFSGKFSILITGRADIIKGIKLNKKINSMQEYHLVGNNILLF